MKAAIRAALPLVLSAFPAVAQTPSNAVETADWTPRSTFERSADFSADPVQEIRAHLTAVVALLEARDVSELPPDLRARRAAHVERLVEYAAAGVFPRNDVKSVPTPIFIDAEGRACAVGHLMIESGAGGVAAEIAATQNTAYVPDITLPSAAEWIRDSGLTLEECALIQPAYGPCGGWWSVHSTVHCDPAVRNSSGWYGFIAACGSADVATNSLSIEAFLGVPNTTGYLLNSLTTGFVMAPGGSVGNLCLSGAVGRYASSAFATDNYGTPVSLPLDLANTPTPDGPRAILPGETWYFQVWYRDGASSNFTTAVGVVFQ